MKEFLDENLTKVLGYIVATFSAVSTLVAAGAFNGLMSNAAERWTAIVCGLVATVFGGATVGRGYNNSTKERVAEAMKVAIQTPAGDPLSPAITKLAQSTEVKP